MKGKEWLVVFKNMPAVIYIIFHAIIFFNSNLPYRGIAHVFLSQYKMGGVMLLVSPLLFKIFGRNEESMKDIRDAKGPLSLINIVALSSWKTPYHWFYFWSFGAFIVMHITPY